MGNIVEHLRREASKQDMLTCEDMLKAADEIERLRAALRDIVNAPILSQDLKPSGYSQDDHNREIARWGEAMKRAKEIVGEQ